MRSWLATRVGDQRVGGVTHAAVTGEDVVVEGMVVEGTVVVDDDECGGREVVVEDREPAGSAPHAVNASPVATTTSTDAI